MRFCVSLFFLALAECRITPMTIYRVFANGFSVTTSLPTKISEALCASLLPSFSVSFYNILIVCVRARPVGSRAMTTPTYSLRPPLRRGPVRMLRAMSFAPVSLQPPMRASARCALPCGNARALPATSSSRHCCRRSEPCPRRPLCSRVTLSLCHANDDTH